MQKTSSWHYDSVCVHMPFLFNWHDLKTYIDYFESRLHDGIQRQILCDTEISTNALSVWNHAADTRAHLKMICCLMTIQPVICVYGYSRCREPARLVGKDRQTGRRFVTEATLIYSSRRSLKSSGSYDRLNVSRDVTFPQNLKRLLRALILSCLIVCWRSYDKQTRVVVGGGKGASGGGEGGLRMGTYTPVLSLLCFATGSRCFWKLPLCLHQRGSKCKIRGFAPQTSRIAGLLRRIWLIWAETIPSTPVTCALIGPKKMHIHPQTDIEQMPQGCCEPLSTWDVAHQRQNRSTTGQSRYI